MDKNYYRDKERKRVRKVLLQKIKLKRKTLGEDKFAEDYFKLKNQKMKRKLKIGDTFTDFGGQKVIVGTDKNGKIILKKYNPLNYREGETR